MRLFARYGIHSGHGLHLSDFVTYDPEGHARYHIVPILTVGGPFLLAVIFLGLRAVRPDRLVEWANRPLSIRFFIGAGLILALLGLFCFCLTRFPQFTWL
jgi:hypothetical protein